MEKIFELAKSFDVRNAVASSLSKEDSDYILSSAFTDYIKDLESGKQFIGIPNAKVVVTNKARKVFLYQKRDSLVLKVLGYSLHIHDERLSDGLFSWKRNAGLHKSIRAIKNISNLDKCYVYSADISKFGESLDENILLNKVNVFFKDDPDFLRFITKSITSHSYYYKYELYNDAPSAKDGNLLTNIMTSIYFLEEDNELFSNLRFYSRFYDDILLIDDDKEKLDKYVEYFNNAVIDKKLKLNQKKTQFFNPGEQFEYLGFKINKNIVDLSDKYIESVRKNIFKMRQQVRILKYKNNYSDNTAMKIFISTIKQGYYPYIEYNFQLLTSIEGIRKIDHLIQDSLRTLGSDKKSKSKYRITHDKMIELKYESLVHKFYQYKKSLN